jgi:hypothetical protein
LLRRRAPGAGEAAQGQELSAIARPGAYLLSAGAAPIYLQWIQCPLSLSLFGPGPGSGPVLCLYISRPLPKKGNKKPPKGFLLPFLGRGRDMQDFFSSAADHTIILACLLLGVLVTAFS